MSDDQVRPRLLWLSQAARRLNLSDESVRLMILRGELQASRIHNRWRLEPAEIERFIVATRYVPGEHESGPKLHAVPQPKGA